MGRVLTVMNMKGGVGKTTVAIHLAGYIARFNRPLRKVLAIDYDPQFNMSQAFLPARTYFDLEKNKKTTLAILLDDDASLNPYELQVSGNHNPPGVANLIATIYKTSAHTGGLDLIPSTLDLMYAALGQGNVRVTAIEERFEKFIVECRSKYDLVIIDCHPAGSLFTKTSLINSDDVLIPVVPTSSYAIRGIGLMMQFIKAKKAGESAPKPHILFNLTARYGTSDEEKRIRNRPEFAGVCMENTLKRFKAFSEPQGGAGFCWSSGKPYSTEALGSLGSISREILQRIGV